MKSELMWRAAYRRVLLIFFFLFLVWIVCCDDGWRPLVHLLVFRCRLFFSRSHSTIQFAFYFLFLSSVCCSHFHLICVHCVTIRFAINETDNNANEMYKKWAEMQPIEWNCLPRPMVMCPRAFYICPLFLFDIHCVRSVFSHSLVVAFYFFFFIWLALARACVCVYLRHFHLFEAFLCGRFSVSQHLARQHAWILRLRCVRNEWYTQYTFVCAFERYSIAIEIASRTMPSLVSSSFDFFPHWNLSFSFSYHRAACRTMFASSERTFRLCAIHSTLEDMHADRRLLLSRPSALCVAPSALVNGKHLADDE